MAGYGYLQTSVAKGRFTLPVVILLCLLLWGITNREWQEAGSLSACILTAYLLTEVNTTFSLIRTRTTLHISFYLFLFSICFFLHNFHATAFVAPVFLLALSQLFKSYDAGNKAPAHVFHAFFFLGLGSLLFPQLLYFALLFYIGMGIFRSGSSKGILAGMLGLLAPYWMFFGYTFCQDKMELFHQLISKVIHFQPISFQSLGTEQIASCVVTLLITATSSIHYVGVAYMDKVRTRLFLSFLIAVEVWICLLGILQPQHANVMLQLQIMIGSILTGHLFMLTQNRFSGIFFIVTFVILMALTVNNLWMQFFNF